MEAVEAEEDAAEEAVAADAAAVEAVDAEVAEEEAAAGVDQVFANFIIFEFLKSLQLFVLKFNSIDLALSQSNNKLFIFC